MALPPPAALLYPLAVLPRHSWGVQYPLSDPDSSSQPDDAEPSSPSAAAAVAAAAEVEPPSTTVLKFTLAPHSGHSSLPCSYQASMQTRWKECPHGVLNDGFSSV